ncbi:hypothetical protein [Rhizobium binxianense]
MLIILIALAVAFSLLAETIYGYLRDRDEAGWGSGRNFPSMPSSCGGSAACGDTSPRI